jgi:hypothetical protein
MPYRSLISAVAQTALLMSIGGAQAADGATFPDWRGQWTRFVVRGLPGQPSHDQTKPWGFGQQAPLTPEYAKVLEESIAGIRRMADWAISRPRGACRLACHT